MADTLESIFLNTSLGATELDDGEHTLLTTDANTSFVIKDMHVNNTSTLTNTHLELNGFNVSGITSNATGSLIIPPSSTLKIKTTDYPLTFLEELRWAANSSEGMFNISYKDNKGNAHGTPFGHYLNGVSDPTNVTDLYYMGNDTNGNPYAFFTLNDGNSSQQIRYWRLDNSNEGNIHSTSYDPFGIYNNKAYFLNGSQLYEQDLFDQPLSYYASAMSVSGSKTNSYAPATQSSYPRARASHGWFWYHPNSSYHGNVYGIRLEGSAKGNWHKFNLATQPSLDGSKNFVVSIDETNDKLYFYHTNSGTSIYQNVYNNYSTFKDTDSASVQNHSSDGEQIMSGSSGGIFASGGALNALGINGQDVSNLADSNMGYDINGGFNFKDSSGGIMVEMNADLTVKAATQNSMSVGSQTINQPNRGHWKKTRTLSSAEATALSFSAPTFGIQLLGVKSTT
tara:strand:- start:4191 stop:5549 length:1359 start_codon:yes stop_codon:yes gene_type:complete